MSSCRATNAKRIVTGIVYGQHSDGLDEWWVDTVDPDEKPSNMVLLTQPIEVLRFASEMAIKYRDYFPKSEPEKSCTNDAQPRKGDYVLIPAEVVLVDSDGTTRVRLEDPPGRPYTAVVATSILLPRGEAGRTAEGDAFAAEEHLCTWCRKPMAGHPMMSCVGEIEPGTVADEVLSMVHAFSDIGRKDAVRALAHRVRRLEERIPRVDKAPPSALVTLEKLAHELEEAWSECTDSARVENLIVQIRNVAHFAVHPMTESTAAEMTCAETPEKKR